ncbi:MAG: D-alanine--D-alanine ligase [Candidatus Omnitrophica bacterium]|nr:D-alanine--D-alanine ligase [Candidatus Omnitrophota bacterium]
MKIVVLCGGDSPEREVSLVSGKSVAKALSKNHRVFKLDPVKKDFHKKLVRIKPDCVFIALHGGKGEDGTIQGFLETLNIPYTGSGVCASAICMNKIIMKKILIFHNIPTPEFVLVERKIIPEIPFGYPCVVKPASLGSTIGISIVENSSQLKTGLTKAFRLDREVFVEKFIKGKEITIGIIGNEKLQVLPPIEIRTSRKLYDYHAKYKKGGSQHVIPPEIDKKFLDKASDYAIKTFKVLGCSGFARMEIIIQENGEMFILDVNTVPGLTPLSLLPDAARHAGISFESLCEKIVELGLERCAKN